MVDWRGGTSAINRYAFCYMLNLFGVVIFHRSMVNWRRGPLYMCILLPVKPFGVVSIPYIYGQLEGGSICPKYMCILIYVKCIWIYFIDLWLIGGGGPWYMCILLYVKLIWCRSIPYIYGQLEGGPSALSICAFCYMLH